MFPDFFLLDTYMNLLDFAKVFLIPVVAIYIPTSQAVDKSFSCSISSPNLDVLL